MFMFMFSRRVSQKVEVGQIGCRANSILALLVILAAGTGAARAATPEDHKPMFAQQLVDNVFAKHQPEIIYIGLHGVTPDSEKSVIFAATKPEKIGQASSPNDVDIIEKGVPIMEMKGKSTTVLERLTDSAGNTVGLLVVGLKFVEGEESQAASVARDLGKEFARQIPSKSALFQPINP
jgi:hypothetical protein